jgi:hypothetical protein
MTLAPVVIWIAGIPARLDAIGAVRVA